MSDISNFAQDTAAAPTQVAAVAAAPALDATTKPKRLPSTKQANLFKEAQADEDAKEEQREHDRKVDLLITPKGHQRLRAFGFEVIYTGKTLAPTTSDRRSL